MATFIDGIAASENIDSSGERILIAGMDISSLAVDGIFNYEHDSKTPSSIVGKVLKAKKIFSDADCDDDRQLYFWNKCKTPYLYVMGELFDDYKDSSREVAGMFRYDSDKKGQNEKSVMNFSIEGAKIDKQGMDIVKSMARKVTITVLPCNKVAVAEMIPAKAGKTADSLDNIFKTENTVEIELFSSSPQTFAELVKREPLKKDNGLSGIGSNAGMAGGAPSSAGGLMTASEKTSESMKKDEAKIKSVFSNGYKIGRTGSGKDVFSHARVSDYAGSSAREHKEIAGIHLKHAEKAKDPKVGDFHHQKMKLHLQAASSAERKESRLDTGKQQQAKRSTEFGRRLSDQVPGFGGMGEVPKMNKTLTAGSGNVAPSQLEGGAALAKEDLVGKKKSKWLARAEEEYQKWEKREQFEQYMAKRMPSLARGEIQAIGQTMCLKKSLEQEAALSDLIKTEDHTQFAVGKTSSGKEVNSHFDHSSHADFTAQDHADAATLHGESAQSSWKLAGSYKQQHKDAQGLRPVRTGKTKYAKRWELRAKHSSVEGQKHHKAAVAAGHDSNKMEKALKFGTPEEQKAVDVALAERKKNPPKRAEPKPKAPDLKGEVHSEVSHTSPLHGDDKYETVHLKSGHELHGHPKGKFKAGDQVTARPHLMGTHVMEHKK